MPGGSLQHLGTSCVGAALAALLLAALPGACEAAVFVCRDANGGTVTSDHLTSDCLQYGGKELETDGSVRRLLLTSQQQREQQAAQQQLQQQRDASLHEQREQRALLGRYPDEATLMAAQADDVKSVQALADAARQRLQVLTREQHKLQQDAQFYPKGDYPADLRGRIELNREQRQQEQQLVLAQQREVQRIRARYATLLAKLRPMWEQQRAAQAGSMPQR